MSCRICGKAGRKSTRAVKQDSFQKTSLGRRRKILAKVRVEPVTTGKPQTRRFRSTSLESYRAGRLRDLRWSPMTSSRVAHGRDCSANLRVRDRRYGIFNLAVLSNAHYRAFQHAHRRTLPCTCIVRVSAIWVASAWSVALGRIHMA